MAEFHASIFKYTQLKAVGGGALEIDGHVRDVLPTDRFVTNPESRVYVHTLDCETLTRWWRAQDGGEKRIHEIAEERLLSVWRHAS